MEDDYRKIGHLEKINDMDYYELRKKQEEIQWQMRKLRNSRPWFYNIGNLIGIIGILIAIITFLASREKKEVLISYSQPQYLLQDTEFTKSKLQIILDDIVYNDVAMYVFECKNIGNKGITSNDFVEGPIIFKIKTDKYISENEKILQVMYSKQTDDSLMELNVEDSLFPASFSFVPSLLNSGESIYIYLYTTCIDPLIIDIEARILNGEVKVEKVENILQNNKVNYPQIMRKIFGGDIWGRIIPILFMVIILAILIFYKHETGMITSFEEVLGMIGYIILIILTGIWTVATTFF